MTDKNKNILTAKPKLLRNILIGLTSVAVLAGAFFAYNNFTQNQDPAEQARASCVDPEKTFTEMAPGETKTLNLGYASVGLPTDDDLQGAKVQARVGSELIVDVATARDNYGISKADFECGDFSVLPEGNLIANSLVTSTNLWPYILNYSPGTATSTTTAGGNANGVSMPIDTYGVIRVRVTLKPDILTRYAVGTIISPLQDAEGAVINLNSTNADSVSRTLAIKIVAASTSSSSSTSTTDSDGDGIPDSVECPTSTNCPDTDGDGTPDQQDTDSDGDGIPDSVESGDTCATVANCVPVDTDNDGTPDYQDTDSDGDGIPDSIEKGDTCATLANCVPVDSDGDGTPDYLDLDSDGDGIPDTIEKGDTCATLANCVPVDTDGDGIPDYLDLDSDNDGFDDVIEKGNTCTTLENCVPVDSTGDGIPDFQDPNYPVVPETGPVQGCLGPEGSECRLYFIGLDNAALNWNPELQFNMAYPKTQKFKDGPVTLVFDEIKKSNGELIADGSTCTFQLTRYTESAILKTFTGTTTAGKCQAVFPVDQQTVNYYNVAVTAVDNTDNEIMEGLDRLVLAVGGLSSNVGPVIE